LWALLQKTDPFSMEKEKYFQEKHAQHHIKNLLLEKVVRIYLQYHPTALTV
jgi:hypothetical protein